MNADIEFEKIISDYVEASKKNGAKRLEFFDEIFSKVKKGNKEGLDALKAIEKKYQDDLKSESDLLESTKNQILELETELKNALDSYYESYSEENEAKKLQESKDKGVAPKTQIYKKDVHDANQKLEKLKKEENEVLKAKQEALDEFDEAYKQKVFELEKKERFELSKEKQANIASCEEYEKSLSETNDKKLIKTINKKIQDIRKVYLKQVKDIKAQYLELIKEEDLAYNNQRKELLIDRVNTEKDFKISKDEIEKEKQLLALNYQMELDRYDFGSKRAVNNLNKKMIEKKNGLIASFKEKEKEAVINYKPQAIELINARQAKSNDYNSVMQENYKAIYETLKVSDTVIDNAALEEINSVHSLFNEMVEYVFINISQIHQDYALNEIKSEYETVKLFTLAKYNQEALVHKNYDEYLNRLQALYDEFKADTTEKGHAFETKLDELFDKVNEFITNIFNTISSAWVENDARMNYHAKLNQIFEECIKDNSAYFTQEYPHILASHPFVDEIVKDYEDSIKDGNKELEEVSNKFDDNDKVIAAELDEYHKGKDQEAKEIEEEFLEKKAESEQEAAEFIKQFEREAALEIASINAKHVVNKKDIEDDYQTSMKLLK